MGWTVGVLFPAGAGIFFLIRRRFQSSPGAYPAGVLSPGIKRLEREANQSLPFSAEVKNAWSYTSTLACLHGVVLSQAQGQRGRSQTVAVRTFLYHLAMA
jgi:hypothetical protein